MNLSKTGCVMSSCTSDYQVNLFATPGHPNYIDGAPAIVFRLCLSCYERWKWQTATAFHWKEYWHVGWHVGFRICGGANCNLIRGHKGDCLMLDLPYEYADEVS